MELDYVCIRILSTLYVREVRKLNLVVLEVPWPLLSRTAVIFLKYEVLQSTLKYLPVLVVVRH